MSRHTVDDLQAIADAIVAMAEPGDVIMTLGAGDVSSLAPIIVDGLARRFNQS